jgi:hypothetical protein
MTGRTVIGMEPSCYDRTTFVFRISQAALLLAVSILLSLLGQIEAATINAKSISLGTEQLGTVLLTEPSLREGLDFLLTPRHANTVTYCVERIRVFGLDRRSWAAATVWLAQ